VQLAGAQAVLSSSSSLHRVFNHAPLLWVFVLAMIMIVNAMTMIMVSVVLVMISLSTIVTITTSILMLALFQTALARISDLESQLKV
jgi:hypothetical protein